MTAPGLVQHAAREAPNRHQLQVQQVGYRHADVGIARRQLIDVVIAEVGASRRHEVPGVRATETTMHAAADG